MGHTRDLVSGLSLLAVAVWFAYTTSGGGGQPALVVAIAGCAGAGVAYLGAAVVDAKQHALTGVGVSREKARGLASTSLGVALVALGVDGLADDLDALALALIGGGSLAVAAGWLRTRRARPARSGSDAGEQASTDEES